MGGVIKPHSKRPIPQDIYFPVTGKERLAVVEVREFVVNSALAYTFFAVLFRITHRQVPVSKMKRGCSEGSGCQRRQPRKRLSI